MATHFLERSVVFNRTSVYSITHQWISSHINAERRSEKIRHPMGLQDVWTSHVTNVSESSHTCEWAMSHTSNSCNTCELVQGVFRMCSAYQIRLVYICDMTHFTSRVLHTWRHFFARVTCPMYMFDMTICVTTRLYVVTCLCYMTHSQGFRARKVEALSDSIWGLLKIIVSFAKEPYKRDDILQKRPIILWSLLIVGQSKRYLIRYGVATISKLLKMIGLFCKRAL